MQLSIRTILGVVWYQFAGDEKSLIFANLDDYDSYQVG